MFLTVSTSDVELDELQERSRQILRSWRALFAAEGRRQPLLGRKTITAAGYIENVPSGDDQDLFNCHFHSVLVMADRLSYSGRDFLRRFNDDDNPANDSQWVDFWQQASGTQPRTAKVSIVRNLGAVLAYSFKSFGNTNVIDADGTIRQPQYVNSQTQQLLPAARLIKTMDATAGLTRVLKHGWLN